ncbi:hypothetical protein [Actinospica robiniae]|uniref:hypothetical protein n=1 Tax=Actinospica robiniae TaxID=304901 RepID=UPI000429EA07|nr:hypothetical protein [Actinospica robiniae]
MSSDANVLRDGTSGLNRRALLGMGAAAGGAVALTGLVKQPASAAESATQRGGPTARSAAMGPNSDGFTMTAQALGVNTTSGDQNFADPVVPGLLTAAGIGRIRYPGGSGADYVNWMAPTAALPWPQYMELLAQIGAAPMVTVNYGSLNQGPDAAAAWVASALTFPNYDAKTAVWLLGNEGYGTWELDQHSDPHTPQSYATNARPYFEAMHRVDPATRVGFPMTIDRTVAGGTGTWVADPDLWNRTVLKQNADQIDFVDFHWYPVFGIPVLSNAQLFETVDRIPGAMRYLQSIISEYAPNSPVVVSESNVSQSEIVYNAQPVAALFAVATALKWLSVGAESYLWWQVHNSDNMNGDFGFLSNGTGTPGPSATTLSAPAVAGARNIAVTDPTGFHYGHQFTLDTGSAVESRKITALPGNTTLSAPAAKGARVIKVTDTSSLTTVGATTDYDQFFAPGTPVVIGSGTSAESHVVEAVGTGASTAALAAPAVAGDKTIRIVGTGMGGQSIPVFMPTGFATGATVTIGSGSGAETATIAAVGTSSSLGTSLAAPASAGDTVLYVVAVNDSNTGVANYVGDPITIDADSAEEVRTITLVGSSASAPTATVLPVKPGDRTVYLASVAGITVGHPLMIGTGSQLQIVSAVAAVGSQTTVSLAAPAAPGATNLKVASTTGLFAGHPVTVDTGASFETSIIQNVGSAGAAGTGVTLSSPLALSHPAGASVVDIGTGVNLSRPIAAAHPAGVPVVDLGTGISVSAPLKKNHAAGAATRDAGSGLTLTTPLKRNHATGEVAATDGTGITLTAPLTTGHAAGDGIVSTGITFTPALSAPHPGKTTVNESGLKEPSLDTPLPAYWGFVLASLMTKPGACLTEITPSSTSTVRAYASYLDGTESICLINTDDVSPVTLAIEGLTRNGTLKTYDYGLLNPSIAEGTASFADAGDGLLLSPESIKVIVGAVGATRPKISVRVHR